VSENILRDFSGTLRRYMMITAEINRKSLQTVSVLSRLRNFGGEFSLTATPALRTEPDFCLMFGDSDTDRRNVGYLTPLIS
jgi:hypothetical protein